MARRATLANQRGAWENALIGTPVADPARPVEILRTIHSSILHGLRRPHHRRPKGRGDPDRDVLKVKYINPLKANGGIFFGTEYRKNTPICF